MERAAESIGAEAKWQARNVDSGMEAVKAEAVAGERKAVTSIQPRSGESCSASERFDPVTVKSETGDAGGQCARRSGLQCSVPCMPVVNRAVNQITWNHFLFVAAS